MLGPGRQPIRARSTKPEHRALAGASRTCAPRGRPDAWVQRSPASAMKPTGKSTGSCSQPVVDLLPRARPTPIDADTIDAVSEQLGFGSCHSAAAFPIVSRLLSDNPILLVLARRAREIGMSPGYYRFPTLHSDRLVFVSEDDLWAVPAAGGVARRLTANLGAVSAPFFSPDGATLAFTGREEGHPEVYVMSSEGGPARRLTYLGAATTVIGWTPGGDRILFASDAGQPIDRVPAVLRAAPGGRPARALAGRSRRQHHVRAGRAVGHRPQQQRPGALEALPRRHGRRHLGGPEGRRPVPAARPACGQPGAPDVDRRAHLLPLRPRGLRQHLLLPARRRRRAPSHRPHRLLRALPATATAGASPTTPAATCSCSTRPPAWRRRSPWSTAARGCTASGGSWTRRATWSRPRSTRTGTRSRSPRAARASRWATGRAPSCRSAARAASATA